ncbi:MAG: sugar transferase [Lachnospiraceae bacterium]
MQAMMYVKRIFDVCISGIALIILSPLFLIVSIAVKLDSKGPILFKQERLGKKGMVFQMFKFRSMVINAEKTGTGLFNYANDPRVTRVGRILRNTSLDELPQLVNVFLGEMSLVGPRPPVTYELGDYKTLNRRYKKRFDMRPGITGLAQVSGRNENSWDEKVDLDNQYIELFQKKGVFFDFIILIKTIGRVFQSENIYEEKMDMTIPDERAAKLAEEEVIAKAHAAEEI